MLDVRFQLKKIARSALAPLLYRYPPFTLAPERLYLFLHHLIETRDVPGAVVEIGCNLGGTAIVARKMLRRLDMNKRYICIDTFDGFVDSQFAADTAHGTPARDRTMFSGNSRVLVGKIMDQPPNLAELIKSTDGVTFWADASKARSELGWHPREAKAGLRDTLAAEGRL